MATSDVAFPQETEKLCPSLMEKSLSDRQGSKTKGQILPRNVAVDHYVPHTTESHQCARKTANRTIETVFKNCFLET